MQRRLRFLSFALFAGFGALVVAALPLFGATPPPTQLQYTVSSKVAMPGAMSLFVHPKATSVTTTIGPARKRIDDDSNNTSQILQCDTKRIIHVDNTAKTYWSMTFDQMKAAMAASEAQLAAQMKGRTPPPAQSGPAQPPIEGSGGLTLSVDTVNDPNTRQILGMTAHHVTETISGTSNGTGQCPNGTLTMSNDEWYIPNPVTFSCPLPRMPPPPAPPMPQGGPKGANPCMSTFQFQASGKAHTTDRFALIQDTTMNIGFKITTHEEVTKYGTQPYDPSFFNPPAGYSQVSAPSDFSGGMH
jgi:hypothetical protein